jgi:PTS system fructose-specific IIB component
MKSGFIKQFKTTKPKKNQESLMKIVGVAACITGVAHTYMAQEAIEQECKKRGYDVKVETQGGMGIENELSEDEIAEADVVILAIAIGIEGVERFEEKEDAGLIISLNPAEVVRDPAAIIDGLKNW